MSSVDSLLSSVYREHIPGFVPFTVEDETIGWLRPRVVEALEAFPAVFDIGSHGVALHASLGTAEARSAAMAGVAEALAREGIVSGWRDELYAAASTCSTEPLFVVERAAARVFGITSHAVHVNGIAMLDGQPSLWIARRSASKAVDPGMLDNMIGGGVANGLSIEETLIKEAWEEAGITAEHATKATPGRRLRIRREVPEGLQSEIIHVYDLVLPPSIDPRNQDGEVSGFALLESDVVIKLLQAGDELTADASLVTLDWLDRAGILRLPHSGQARAIFHMEQASP